MSLTRRAALIALILLPFGTPVGAEGINIYFKTSPGTEQLRAGAETANLALLVAAEDGRPVQQGWVLIGLDAPVPGHFFSTDFPLVEGSRLADLRLPLRRGKAEWRYLFPIRGEYRLTIAYATDEGIRATRIFKLTIREKETKWLVLGSFMSGLFFLGFIAGRIFSSREALRRPVGAACLLFLTGWFFPWGAYAAEQQAAQQKYIGQLDVAPARVGQPALVRWRLVAEGATEKPAAALTLIITHLEKEKTVFAVEKVFVAEEFSMKFHFTDGARYRISAVADIPGRRSLRTEQELSVTAVEPPARAMAPALALFLIVITSGLIAGRWSRR